MNLDVRLFSQKSFFYGAPQIIVIIFYYALKEKDQQGRSYIRFFLNTVISIITAFTNGLKQRIYAKSNKVTS